MNNLSFKGSNVVELSTWLKRFPDIDKNVLVEIDTQTNEFLAKTYTPDKSIVKFCRVSFADLGFTLTSKPIDERVKMGLYDITRINKLLGQFAGDDFEFIVKYDKIINDDETHNLGALQILVKNSVLKAGQQCGSLSIFEYLPDFKFNNVISNIPDVKGSFDLKREDLEKILALGDLDKDHIKLSFDIRDGKVLISSRSFEYEVGLSDKESFHFPMLKKQIARLDRENYHVTIGGNRALFKSTDSDSDIVIGILNESNTGDSESDKKLDLE